MYKGFWWGILRERDHLEGLGVEDNIKIDPQEVSWEGLD